MTVQDKTTSPIVLLLIPIATIMLIYGYLLFLSIKSIAKARGNPQTVSFGRAFYIMISLVPLSRIVSLIIVSYEILVYEDIEIQPKATNDIFGLMFLSLNYLPDLFLVLSFSIYGWLVLLVYLFGLIHLPHPHLASPNCKNALFIIWVIFIFCLELAQIVGFLNYLFNREHFDFAAYVLLNGITSLAIAAFVIITEIVLHFVFSGIPFKAGFHQKRFSLVNRILLYWGLASAGKGVLNILQKDQIEKVWRAIIEDISTPIDNIVPPLLLILQLFFVEIVPILLVNDSKVYSHLFVKSRRDSVNQALFQETSRQNLPENVESQAISSSESGEKNEDIFYYQVPQGRTTNGPKERKTLGGNRAVDPKDVVLGQKEEEERADYLGVIFSAQHKGEKLKARVIKLKKLTPYLAEEINREVLRFMQFNCPNLLRIRGVNCQDPEVTIYYESAEQINLHDLLYKQQQEFSTLTFTLKIKVAILFAAAMRYLHSQEPKVVHGHLKPSNILIDKEGNVKVADYGLFNLKKYANIMIGYMNVDQYTAPEIFSDKGTIIQPENGAVDVYSFGVILWELITEKVPFEGLSVPELYQLICKEASRPKIPAETLETLQSIIRACWQQDPKKRPSFEEIIEILQDEVLS